MLFPGAGLLVLSAWCLGVLNSHHRFLLSYTAPRDVERGDDRDARRRSAAGTTLPRLAVLLAWGSVVGSALQFAVQVPVVLQGGAGSALRARHGLARTCATDRRAISCRSFISRGVVQFSAYIDRCSRACCRPARSPALTNAQLLYTLPVSLFGMSVVGGGTAGDVGRLRERRRRSIASCGAARRRPAPASRSSSSRRRWRSSRSATSSPPRCLQTGRFTSRRRGLRLGHPGRIVGRSAGVDARAGCTRRPTTRLRDTRTPLRFAIVRVVLTTVLGYVCAIPLPRLLGLRAGLGRGRSDRVGRRRRLGRDAAAARRRSTRASAGPDCRRPTSRSSGDRRSPPPRSPWAIKIALPALHPIVTAMLVLGPYGARVLRAGDRAARPGSVGRACARDEASRAHEDRRDAECAERAVSGCLRSLGVFRRGPLARGVLRTVFR